MNVSPRQRRAERRNRNQTMVDMNLVSLIDVFTILIFFLLSNSSGMETLASPKSIHLPESVAETSPRVTVVVSVNNSEIAVDGRLVASVSDVMAQAGDVIDPLLAELAMLKSARLTIMGDKEIPYRLLRKIMVTSAQAKFSDVSFAVRQKGGT